MTRAATLGAAESASTGRGAGSHALTVSLQSTSRLPSYAAFSSSCSDVLSLPLFNDAGTEGTLNGGSPGRTKVMEEAEASCLIASSRPPASAPIPMDKVKQEETGSKDRQEDK